jgi:hypothetical protein
MTAAVWTALIWTAGVGTGAVTAGATIAVGAAIDGTGDGIGAWSGDEAAMTEAVGGGGKAGSGGAKSGAITGCIDTTA